jgi:farnesyl diphosphate synthase/geranylgeranyl diphosphate synthase type II
VLTNDDRLSAQVRIALLQELTHAAFEMAEGQSIDLSVASKTIDIETLQNMHRKKTGALLSCAVKLGALVSNQCRVEDRQILNGFAQDIGLAYQVQDDVLDVLTPGGVLGKKQHSDADKNKPTYPALLGLDKATKTYLQLYQQAFKKLDKLRVDANELRNLTEQLQSRKF